MKNSNTLSKEFIEGTDESKKKLIEAKIKLNIADKISHPFNNALAAINKLLELSNERELNLEEIIFLDGFLNLIFVIENEENLAIAVENHLAFNNNLINEIFPIENSPTANSHCRTFPYKIDFVGKDTPFDNQKDFNDEGSI